MDPIDTFPQPVEPMVWLMFITSFVLLFGLLLLTKLVN